jgi:hypothetical protein
MRILRRGASLIGAGIAALLAIACGGLALYSLVFDSTGGAGPFTEASGAAWIAAALMVGFGALAGWLYERD